MFIHTSALSAHPKANALKHDIFGLFKNDAARAFYDVVSKSCFVSLK